MRNVRLDLAYDGARFVGWQVQPNGRSIQAELEAAILKLTGEQTRLLTAGRTDSGVHAIGQVANFQTRSRIPVEKMRRALQSFVSPEIGIRRVTNVNKAFHATYSAIKKRYRYLIWNSQISDPFLRNYTWQIRPQLNMNAMRLAAQSLVGTHDFRCFETQFPNKATSVRTILQAELAVIDCPLIWSAKPLAPRRFDSQATENSLPRLLAFEVEADGFLYNMVRAIVGTLVAIGRGRWPPTELQRIIRAQDRSQAGETAPPQGLFLVEVTYPDEETPVSD